MNRVLGLIVIAVLLGVGFVYGVPYAQQWYQTERAAIRIHAIDAEYANEIAAAKAQYIHALEDARASRSAALASVRLDYPRATLPRSVTVSDHE